MNTNIFIKNGSTLLLKIIISIIGIAVLLLCIFILPRGIADDNAGMYRSILIGMYIPAIPFFIGLYQTLKLLRYIDQDKVFSEASVKALRLIKFCASIVSGVYLIGLPYIFMVAERDDAPGVMLIGLIFTFAPLIIAVFAAVFQKVLQNAIAIKLENDELV